jgi:hypothetical protein
MVGFYKSENVYDLIEKVKLLIVIAMPGTGPPNSNLGFSTSLYNHPW